MRGELSSVVLGEREGDRVERRCCSNVAVAPSRTGGKASRTGFYKGLCPLVQSPRSQEATDGEKMCSQR